MLVHVVIVRRSEAVQKGNDTESRASRARPVTVTGQARRSTEQPLDLFDEDPREGRYRALAVSEEAAQPLRHGDHPLPHGHRGNDAVDEMRGCLRHSTAVARRADTPALAREGDDKTLPGRFWCETPTARDRPGESVGGDGEQRRRAGAVPNNFSATRSEPAYSTRPTVAATRSTARCETESRNTCVAGT